MRCGGPAGTGKSSIRMSASHVGWSYHLVRYRRYKLGPGKQGSLSLAFHYFNSYFHRE